VLETDDFVTPWTTKWKEIPGFPGYWVSDNDLVFSMRNLKLLALYRNTKHMLCVSIYQDGKRKSRTVGVLRRRAFGEK
jgi:hypothetical protein